jgi:hypothetical protein
VAVCLQSAHLFERLGTRVGCLRAAALHWIPSQCKDVKEFTFGVKATGTVRSS